MAQEDRLPVMRAQRSGLIVTISWTAGVSGQEFTSAYAASKFALEGWMESLAPEVAPLGIDTMLVEPGFLPTIGLLDPKSDLDRDITDHRQRVGDVVCSLGEAPADVPARAISHEESFMNNVHRTRIGGAIAVSFRQLRAPLIISLGLVGFAAPTAVSAAPAGKTTICHATGSAKNPYVRITVSNEALAAHGAHQDGRDIIPAPDTCPASVPPPPPVDACPNIPGDQSTVPEGFVVDGAGNCVPDPVLPFIECVVSDGVMQTATTVTGTPADDTIDCSAASPGKTIDTFAGNDTITGTVFLDVITSGDGNDTVTGLAGNDVIDAGEGNNTVTGGLGDDTVTAGTGSDTLTGSEGNDFLDGGTGIDTLSGGPGNDDLVGPNNDSSVDTVSGGDGANDVCTGPGLDFDIVSGCETETA